MSNRKLTAEEKRRKRKRKAETQIIFINGRQKRVPRPPTIGGIPIEKFIAQNADLIWLVENGMWEYLAEEDAVDLESRRSLSPPLPRIWLDLDAESAHEAAMDEEMKEDWESLEESFRNQRSDGMPF